MTNKIKYEQYQDYVNECKDSLDAVKKYGNGFAIEMVNGMGEEMIRELKEPPRSKKTHISRFFKKLTKVLGIR